MTQRILYGKVAPDAFKGLLATRPYLKTSSLGDRLRALVELRTSQINGCAYCVDVHSREPGSRARPSSGSIAFPSAPATAPSTV